MPKIRALDGKTMLLVDSDSSKTSTILTVSDADPNGPMAGKCSVFVQEICRGNTDWHGSGSSPCSGPTKIWSRFLGEEAVRLICTNNPEDSCYGELLLVAPAE